MSGDKREMREYGVMLTPHGSGKVMTVVARDVGEARARAEDQLRRPGRYGILKLWQENGSVVKPI